jgi:hypothetical protein
MTPATIAPISQLRVFGGLGCEAASTALVPLICYRFLHLPCSRRYVSSRHGRDTPNFDLLRSSPRFQELIRAK